MPEPDSRCAWLLQSPRRARRRGRASLRTLGTAVSLPLPRLLQTPQPPTFSFSTHLSDFLSSRQHQHTASSSCAQNPGGCDY